jgi:NADPH:quinone reductase-like Zn-dependent oxidoreductase
VVTHERLLAAIPDNLSDEEAAGVPEVFMTAHDALGQAALRPGARVLIHAVGSGVGTAALQLVNAVNGTVLGTSRTPEKLRRAAQLGALHSLPLPHFAEALEASDGGGPVDIVLDFVGGPYLAGNLRALAPRGRLVQIGTLADSHAELDLGLLLRKRLTVIGTALRSRPLEEKALLTQSFAREVVPLLQSGRLRAVIDRAFDLGAAADAHRYLESNASFGKVLLRIGN